MNETLPVSQGSSVVGRLAEAGLTMDVAGDDSLVAESQGTTALLPSSSDMSQRFGVVLGLAFQDRRKILGCG